MNEDIWITLSAYRRKALKTIAVFGALVCCVAFFVLQHFGQELSHQFLGDLAMSQARQLGESFGSDVEDPLRAAAKERTLIDLSTRMRDYFVAVRVIDHEGAVKSLTVLPSYVGIEDRFDACRDANLNVQRQGCEEAMPDGARILLVRVPFGASSGWFFEGIYRVSVEAVREVRSVYVAIIALVVVTLVVTIGLMYPVARFLQSNLLSTSKKFLAANLEMLKSMGCAIAKRDSDTGDHNYRVTMYAIKIAEKIGINQASMRGLIKGALLHDVGKIAIRDAILLKPGPLNAEEFAEMQKHVTHGLEIIASDAWLADARDIVGGHHEKVDGTGYPRGLRGEEIPLAARIFAVADVFDALMSRRPYKAPMTLDQGLSILAEGRGKHFDPNVLDAFFWVVEDMGQDVFQASGNMAEGFVEDMIRQYFEISPRFPVATQRSWRLPFFPNLRRTGTD
ncbi:MAG: HD-GYP domain-containing protein [Rhodospirillaceae bacterium]|nr:HD-GYP domain-containing protein [Rhodospirillaceae bacterium]